MTCFWRGTKSKVKTDLVDYECSVRVAYCSHKNGTLVAFVSMKVTGCLQCEQVAHCLHVQLC
jgi:hypothetical protein